MPGAASISGVVSGMKTDEIIAKIMELERAPITRLEAEKTALQAKVSAWQELNTRILALKSKADELSKGSTFQAKIFASTDETILTGSASYTAQAGTYFIKVNAIAKTHQLTTQGYDNTDTTTVGAGTITITVGSGTPKVITIDDTNNTLQGVRDAINKSGAGVTASIINDGSQSAPYRLLVTSNTSGAAGEVDIGLNLSGGTTPVFSDLHPAQDASITLGEGTGAITVSKGSNTITDLIPGATLNLRDADVAKTVTVTIGNNTASVKQTITDFATQFNNLIDYINAQFRYDTRTNTGGTLFGDSRLRALQSDLRSKVSNPITELSQSVKLLSQIGITSTAEDKLVINTTDLDEALTGNLDSVKRLFATLGETSHPSISYVSSTRNTKPSSAAGYAISITTVPVQARVTAGVAQTQPLGTDETLTINGVDIQLTQGMTQDQVIAEINSWSSKTGVIASATGITGSGTGNYLTLRRIGYGSAAGVTAKSNVSNGGGTPVDHTSGIGTTEVTETNPAGEAGTGTGNEGVDVAGTINGEPATGQGQVLTGNTGNENTEGLKIRFTGTSTGSYGTIVFTRGVGGVVADFASFVTDSATGSVTDAQKSLNTRLESIEDEISDMETRLAASEERLFKQFTMMESALNRLQTQSAFLTQQLLQVQNSWR